MKQAETHNETNGATLIFDGSCPICSGTVKWIAENERAGSFEMLPCQSETAAARFPGIERAACMKAMHLVLPEGKVLVGEQAMPEIMMRLKGYRMFAPMFKLPGAAVLSRIAYRWFADRRYRIAALLSHFRGSGKDRA